MTAAASLSSSPTRPAGWRPPSVPQFIIFIGGVTGTSGQPVKPTFAPRSATPAVSGSSKRTLLSPLRRPHLARMYLYLPSHGHADRAKIGCTVWVQRRRRTSSMVSCVLYGKQVGPKQRRRQKTALRNGMNASRHRPGEHSIYMAEQLARIARVPLPVSLPASPSLLEKRHTS